MNSAPLPIYLSAIDEQRFGIRTSRAWDVTLDTLPAIIDFCRENNVMLLIARCATTELKAVQAMEREGFLLMDTLVYYARDLRKSPVPTDQDKISIRPVRDDEAESIKRAAARTFKGYFGHYHADERLDRAQCDEVYADWAMRSCVSKEATREVLVADENGAIRGFIALRLNGLEEGEGVLFAVTPEAQGQGISRSLMIHAMQWCLSEQANRMVISTQITNIASQKVWARLGFEVSHAYYTLHKWFEPETD